MLKRALKRASEELDKAVDDLRNELFAKTLEDPQTSFKTREVYDIIRRQYFDLICKNEFELFLTNCLFSLNSCNTENNPPRLFCPK